MEQMTSTEKRSTAAKGREILLEREWKEALLPEFQKPYMNDLRSFLIEEKKKGKEIFPAGSAIFQAFEYTPLSKVKVVILGQDPYHGVGQAHGLSFSVPVGQAIPPSLQNIYKELYSDLGITPAKHGYLRSWAEQGVLLLNAVLTVERDLPASHQKRGWEQFTDAVISVLNAKRENLVFMLWGRYAFNKGQHIDKNRHLVLTAAHPSPFSAYNGFFGCKHFSLANQYLVSKNLPPINWQIQ